MKHNVIRPPRRTLPSAKILDHQCQAWSNLKQGSGNSVCNVVEDDADFKLTTDLWNYEKFQVDPMKFVFWPLMLQPGVDVIGVQDRIGGSRPLAPGEIQEIYCEWHVYAIHSSQGRGEAELTRSTGISLIDYRHPAWSGGTLRIQERPRLPRSGLIVALEYLGRPGGPRTKNGTLMPRRAVLIQPALHRAKSHIVFLNASVQAHLAPRSIWEFVESNRV